MDVVKKEDRFIQIPGPNPILRRGEKGAWDERLIECCDVLKDYETYYLYYHGEPSLDNNQYTDKGYRIGVATASYPLGPWKKYEKNPIMDLGPEGSWDCINVACASIIKEGTDKYYMWYTGASHSKGVNRKRSIGLATASNPLGPWKKYKGNPIIENFGYVGAVLKIKGKYYVYTEHPINSTGPDYGPISLATAASPEGPWKICKKNPVLAPGDWGSWDDGGFSEAEVTYREGIIHIFYGGAKLHPTRIRTLESIGYAYSLDGIKFTKHPENPVALRENNPNASAFAEVHTLFESPFVYLYHTLRYVKGSRPDIEDLGVQILVRERAFSLTMPVLNINSVNKGKTTSLQDCSPISVGETSNIAITAECRYHADAKAGMRIHIRSSYDGINYDTLDLYAFENHFKPGKIVRKTTELNPKVKFIKVLVENLDRNRSIRNIKVTAVLSR